MIRLKYDISLEELTIENIRSFSKLEVSFPKFDSASSQKNVTAFIANNGGGKTTILDVIAENMRLLISNTFLKKDNFLPNILASDVSLSTKALNGRSTCHWLISWEDLSERGNLTPTILPVSNILPVSFDINKSDNDFYCDFITMASSEDDGAFHKEFLKHTSQISLKDQLPVMAYYGDKSSFAKNNIEEPILSFDKRIQLVYGGALEPNRYNFERFLNWFCQKERESQQHITSHQLPEIELMIQGLWADNENNIISEDKINNLKIKIDEINEIKPKHEIKIVKEAILNGLNNYSIPPNLNKNSKKYTNLKINFDGKSESILIDIDDSQGVNILQMSAGEKNIFCLVADLAMRLIEANPVESGENPLDGSGVVLIDEIDLHLHVKWQTSIIPTLIMLFPNIQFIVTTHSPLLLQSVDVFSRKILVNNSILEVFAEESMSYEAIMRDYFDFHYRYELSVEGLLRTFYEKVAKIKNGELHVKDTEFIKIIKELSNKGDSIRDEIEIELLKIKDLIKNG